LVKGMGEKQIEVDKRILRTQVCHDESQQCLLTHSHIRCHLLLTLSTSVT
jgi:hypothetical protein